MKKLFSFAFWVFTSMACFGQEIGKITVYFELDKYVLDDHSKSKIDSLLQKNDGLEEVRIQAHCDSRGSDEYNEGLSLKRALEVKQYLISKNKNSGDVSSEALGERMPLNKNRNEEEMAMNRRVEIFYTIRRPVPPPVVEVLPPSQAPVAVNKVPAQPPPVPVPVELESDSEGYKIENISVGRAFVLKNMNFYPGKHTLMPGSDETLAVLLKTMKNNPTLEIEIHGHICCIDGGDAVDIENGKPGLSIFRAQVVYNYLIKNGIEATRVTYRGFGSKFKLADELTEAGKATNRRVEVKIIKK